MTNTYLNRQIDAVSKIDRQTDRQTDRRSQPDRQIDRQTDRQTDTFNSIPMYPITPHRLSIGDDALNNLEKKVRTRSRGYII